MYKMILKNEKSFLEGSIWDKMILFIIPLVVTSIIQQLFNTADKIIAGRFISENAYGAIGLTSTISNFFIEFFMGFSGATTVVIAKYIGMGRKDRAKAAVNTAIPFSLFVGIFCRKAAAWNFRSQCIGNWNRNDKNAIYDAF